MWAQTEVFVHQLSNNGGEARALTPGLCSEESVLLRFKHYLSTLHDEK